MSRRLTWKKILKLMRENVDECEPFGLIIDQIDRHLLSKDELKMGKKEFKKGNIHNLEELIKFVMEG